MFSITKLLEKPYCILLSCPVGTLYDLMSLSQRLMRTQTVHVFFFLTE